MGSKRLYGIVALIMLLQCNYYVYGGNVEEEPWEENLDIDKLTSSFVKNLSIQKSQGFMLYLNQDEVGKEHSSLLDKICNSIAWGTCPQMQGWMCSESKCAACSITKENLLKGVLTIYVHKNCKDIFQQNIRRQYSTVVDMSTVTSDTQAFLDQFWLKHSLSNKNLGDSREDLSGYLSDSSWNSDDWDSNSDKQAE